MSLQAFFIRMVFFLALTSCATSVPAEFDLSKAPAGKTWTAEGDYIISATDRLEIRVSGDPTLNGSYVVAQDGTLSFPLAGFVRAEGLTVRQITQELEGKLKTYLRDPKVNVAVAAPNSFVVFFNGEVGRVGAVNLFNRTTLIQGMSMAGGLGRYAKGRVVLMRRMGDKTVRYSAEWKDIVSGVLGLDKFQLERGDVIFVE